MSCHEDFLMLTTPILILYCLEYLWSVAGAAFRQFPCRSSRIFIQDRTQLRLFQRSFLSKHFYCRITFSILLRAFLQACIQGYALIPFLFGAIWFLQFPNSITCFLFSLVSEAAYNGAENSLLFDGTICFFWRWNFSVKYLVWHQRHVQPLWYSWKEDTHSVFLDDFPYRLCLCSSTVVSFSHPINLVVWIFDMKVTRNPSMSI